MTYTEVTGSLKDLSNTDRSRLKKLLSTAELSSRRNRHAAAAYRGGSLLAVGINSTRMNSPTPIEDKFPSEHAEEAVLRQLSDPAGVVFYVARAKRDGTPGLSRPCENCSRQLREAKVRKVVYTSNEYLFDSQC